MTLSPSGAQPFLPASVYGSAAIAQQERERYATQFWHPVASLDALPPGHSLALEVQGLPVLLTRTVAHSTVAHNTDDTPIAFVNRCPHRGVALLEATAEAQACRRLICPYHGWTYNLQGELLAAAREGDFLAPFDRRQWPLVALPCQVFANLIWVAIAADPMPLDQQLDLVLEEAADRLDQPRVLLAQRSRTLQCNWKIAHDNTLDDYHVAIAHPTTLHREQGPVRQYRHALSRHGSLLATPYPAGGEFLTFGLAPWTHLLLWPDGRMGVINFPPLDLQHCRMEVWLLGDPSLRPGADAWMEEVLRFLEEDRLLVESAQIGYASGLVPGPPHRLEQRILQHQALYAALMGFSAPALQP